jgi:hypothetical protein
MKKMSILGILAICLLEAAPERRLCSVAITGVSNESPVTVQLHDETGDNSIQPLMTKKLRRPFMIPFISVDQYLEKFLEDTPYIPEKALLVTTGKGILGVWEDETGIVTALSCEQGQQKECIARKLFRSVNSNEFSAVRLATMISFLLIVNAQGELHLKEYVHP